MGSGGSKPEQHVFNADAPVRFSQSVLNSFQNNSESDSTRAQSLELKIQSRVNSELTRIRDAQAKQLSSLTSSLTTDRPEASSSSSSEASAPVRAVNSLAAHLSSPFYQDHSGSASATSSGEKMDSGRSHDSVNKEVAELRAKLEARKKIEQLPANVEQAKDSLVNCLRTNDRRPLDCWQEVEMFKVEVGKLERQFIQNAGR